ncbi:MAG: tetratricopeptide repeat protein [Candidatus Sericytochromatia bacterium]
MQDFNSPDIDHEVLCNLALEEAIKCADSGFENFDIFLRSLSYFLEALEINPNNYRTHLGLGIILLCADSYEEALIFLQNANDMKPEKETLEYIKFAEESLRAVKSTKVETAVAKKKVAIDDILQMTNKFKK